MLHSAEIFTFIQYILPAKMNFNVIQEIHINKTLLFQVLVNIAIANRFLPFLMPFAFSQIPLFLGFCSNQLLVPQAWFSILLLLIQMNLLNIGSSSKQVSVLKYKGGNECSSDLVGVTIKTSSSKSPLHDEFTFCGKYYFRFLRSSCLITAISKDG